MQLYTKCINCSNGKGEQESWTREDGEKERGVGESVVGVGKSDERDEIWNTPYRIGDYNKLSAYV